MSDLDVRIPESKIRMIPCCCVCEEPIDLNKEFCYVVYDSTDVIGDKDAVTFGFVSCDSDIERGNSYCCYTADCIIHIIELMGDMTE